MKRLLTLAFLLLTLCASARATGIVISSQSVPNWRYGSPAALRIYVSGGTFTDTDGIVHVAQTTGGPNFYASITCSVSGTTLTIPSFTIASTVDSPDNPNATYTFIFYQNNVRKDTWAPSFRIPTILGTTITWQRLRVYMAGSPNPPRPGFPDIQQVQALINAVLPAPKASDVISGIIRLRTPAAVTNDPEVWGTNDTAVVFAGKIGLNGTAVDATKYLNLTATGAYGGDAVAQYGIYSSVTGTDNTNIRGGYFEGKTSSVGGLSPLRHNTIFGIDAKAYYGGSTSNGRLDNLVGGQFLATNEPSEEIAGSFVQDAYSVYAQVGTSSFGNTKRIHGVLSDVYWTFAPSAPDPSSEASAFEGKIRNLASSGGGANTAYGLRLDGWSGTGFTTSYGIYLGSSIGIGTTKYAIYSLSTAPSVLSGNLSTGNSFVKGTLQVQNSGGSGTFNLAGSVGKIVSYGSALPLDGQLLIGNTITSTYDVGSLTAGSGINITNGGGTITIAATVPPPVTDATISISDITTNNVSSTKHGFAPKSPGNASQFLNGAATPAYTTISSSTLSDAANIPLLNAANTFTGANVFSSTTGQSIKKLLMPGATSGTLTVLPPDVAGSASWKFPGGTTDFSASGGASQLVRQSNAGGGLTVAALTASDLPYKEYVVTINQSSTGAPTLIEGINTTGATVTAARSGTGTYTLTFNSAVLTTNKTFPFINFGGTGVAFVPSAGAAVTSTTVITIKTWDVATSSLRDGALTDGAIRVIIVP